MSVLIICFGVAAAAAIVTALLARLWWSSDVGAPQADAAAVAATVRRHVVAARWVRDHLNPDVATGTLLGVVAVVFVVGGGLFGVLLEMVRAHRGFADFDTSATRFAAAHANSGSTHVLRIVTQFGGAVLIVPIAVVVGIVEARRLRSWSTVTFLALVVGGQFLVADLIKAVVGRARPHALRLTGFSGPSFPSGHATASAAVFAAFALLIGRGRSHRTKVALAASSIGGAVLIASTRVMLGVHWLTDVLAGLCLGWTWFALVSIAFGGRRLRFGAPLETAEAVVDTTRTAPHPAQAGAP